MHSKVKFKIFRNNQRIQKAGDCSAPGFYDAKFNLVQPRVRAPKFPSIVKKKENAASFDPPEVFAAEVAPITVGGKFTSTARRFSVPKAIPAMSIDFKNIQIDVRPNTARGKFANEPISSSKSGEHSTAMGPAYYNPKHIDKPRITHTGCGFGVSKRFDLPISLIAGLKKPIPPQDGKIGQRPQTARQRMRSSLLSPRERKLLIANRAKELSDRIERTKQRKSQILKDHQKKVEKAYQDKLIAPEMKRRKAWERALNASKQMERLRNRMLLKRVLKKMEYFRTDAQHLTKTGFARFRDKCEHSRIQTALVTITKWISRVKAHIKRSRRRRKVRIILWFLEFAKRENIRKATDKNALKLQDWMRAMIVKVPNQMSLLQLQWERAQSQIITDSVLERLNRMSIQEAAATRYGSPVKRSSILSRSIRPSRMSSMGTSGGYSMGSGSANGSVLVAADVASQHMGRISVHGTVVAHPALTRMPEKEKRELVEELESYNHTVPVADRNSLLETAITRLWLLNESRANAYRKLLKNWRDTREAEIKKRIERRQRVVFGEMTEEDKAFVVEEVESLRPHPPLRRLLLEPTDLLEMIKSAMRRIYEL
eukprot:TRINITY_DN773077_c0_g1_i1.p1 TRINITY_DN773077_c0_g1~~TRINITY_DN773077_c0_g1_i1.p1  ORF type:complete len:598 (+),score=97.00 TRINITY_DN773077_c0_g1_i1:187-1980(+)